VIFAALNSDDYQLRFIPGFELPQLRKYMNAVYSAIRPEVEQNYFPAKIGKLERLSAGMYPVDIVRKFG
jgi:hypothetical protein